MPSQLAESSYNIFPSVEAAREASRWLSAAGKDQQALQFLADAFTIGGLHSADAGGAGDRARMGELYRKLHGSDTGLGDLILKAYDATSSQLAARRAELREFDPNAELKNPIQFTLSGLEGDKLQLSSLLGKVVVMDFWATWCAPCRQQHPLYEQVKAKFKDSGDVVFLAVDTDEDHSLVKPFLIQIKWSQNVYFEDGLQSLLQVSSIPTTIILGKKGEIFTRMVGFLPDRFVDMLTERVNDALGKTMRPIRKGISVPQLISVLQLINDSRSLPSRHVDCAGQCRSRRDAGRRLLWRCGQRYPGPHRAGPRVALAEHGEAWSGQSQAAAARRPRGPAHRGVWKMRARIAG